MTDPDQTQLEGAGEPSGSNESVGRVREPRLPENFRQLVDVRISQAMKLIEESPEISKGSAPLYRIPWYMVLGDDRATPRDFLAGLSSMSPFEPPEPDGPAGSSLWSWWLFKKFIGIEVSPALVSRDDDDTSRVWKEFFLELQKHRARLPMNGVIVLVSADILLNEKGQLREYGMKIRKRFDEIKKALRITVPMYLVVTHLENVRGFGSLLEALPKSCREQAFGHIFSVANGGGNVGKKEVGDAFEEIEDRLKIVCLSVIKERHSIEARYNIWMFARGFMGLQDGLIEVCKTLLDDNPYQQRPQLRGVYFCGVEECPGFLVDLGERFLPADQPLARMLS